MSRQIEKLLEGYDRVTRNFPGASEMVAYEPRYPQRVVVVRRAPGWLLTQVAHVATAAFAVAIFVLVAVAAQGLWAASGPRAGAFGSVPGAAAAPASARDAAHLPGTRSGAQLAAPGSSGQAGQG
jgi:hypothetical protein